MLPAMTMKRGALAATCAGLLAAGGIMNAQAPTPFKLGTFQLQNRTFIGIVGAAIGCGHDRGDLRRGLLRARAGGLGFGFRAGSRGRSGRSAGYGRSGGGRFVLSTGRQQQDCR